MHEGHLSGVTERDRPAVIAAAPELLKSVTFTGTAEELQARAGAYAAAGYTELVFQPAGPDIPGELERMGRVLGL